MKRFAKLTALFAALVLTIATAGLASCMHDNHEADDIARLLREGYDCTMQIHDDQSWAGLFEKDGSYFKVTASMSKAQAEAMANLDLMDEDYDAKLRSLLESFTVLSCEDLASRIPSQKDVDAWVGKTIGDAERAGMEQNGFFFNGDYAEFTYTDGTLTYNLTVDGPFTEAQWDAMTPEDQAKLTITKATFGGFDLGILE